MTSYQPTALFLLFFLLGLLLLTFILILIGEYIEKREGILIERIQKEKKKS